MNFYERIKKRRQSLQSNRYVRYNNENNYDEPPDWFIMNDFLHAQKLFYTYKSTFILCYLYGLSLTIHNREELIPLLITNRSKSVAHLFERYLSTVEHIVKWFTDNPFDLNSESFKSLSIVRKMHNNVAKKLNTIKTSKNIDYNNCWINQYRMLNGQFAFVGFFAIFPNQLGFKLLNAKDRHCIFHFWRTIGYCLGIDDQYNLCSGSDDEIIEMCRQIFHEEWLPMLEIKSIENKSLKIISHQMSRSIFDAFNHFEPFINYKIFMRYGCYHIWSSTLSSYLNKNDLKINNFLSNLHYYFTIIAFKFFSQLKLFHWIASRWFEFRFWQAKYNRQKYFQQLQQIYPNNIYDNNNNIDNIFI